MAASRVQQFMEQAGCRKRSAPAGSEQPPAAKQLFLPVYLFLEHGKLEAREQLLWRLGDAKASPAAAARAFVQQYLQQPHVVERESQRLQNDLQKLIEQHKDVQHAPAAPTLVRLEVRCSLPHMEALYVDDPWWDLSAPRAACEAYIAAVCNELGLDWAAHTHIMRRMKDAIDAAARDLAAGKAQVVAAPTAPHAAEPPSRMPRVVRPNEQQRAAMRKALLARQPFADGGSEGQHGTDASAFDSLLPGATDASAAAVKAKGGDAAATAAEQVEAALKQEGDGSQGAAAAAVADAADAEAAEAEEDAAEAAAAVEEAAAQGAEEADGEPEVVELQQLWQREGGTSSEDMPDLPMDDEWAA